MNLRFTLLVTVVSVSLLGLTACSSDKTKTSKAGSATLANTPKLVNSSLDTAAVSVSTSLSELAAVQKSLHPAVKAPFVGVKGTGLNRSVALSWNGPIEPLLRRVSKAIGYQLQVYGKKPVIPVLVDIDTTRHLATAKQVFSNADLQAGTKAQVLLYPKEKIVSLRYQSP